MKLAILTSSRADFGIYLPLIKKLELDSDLCLEIIAFGTHLSRYHGYTIEEIQSNTNCRIQQVESMMLSDTESSIASAYGLTALKFADFWSANKYDIVFCLGDRYEMAAAVTAGVPHQINFAHLHGGETTLGAIDNVYRHQITLASKYHFTSTSAYADKVAQLIGNDKNVSTVGALSLDGLDSLEIMSSHELAKKFNFPDKPFLLCTFHPETINSHQNSHNAVEWCDSMRVLSRQMNVIITMPNADTMGTVLRNELLKLKKACPEQVYLVEHFGKAAYFAAMSHCKLMIGNTSSGIIEGASFGKYVVNVGQRQRGRTTGANVSHVSNKSEAIVITTQELLKKENYRGGNIYYINGAASLIHELIKGEFNATL